MKKTLVTGFGGFLQHNVNSTYEFVKDIPNSNDIITQIFPVGYFKNSFIAPIKKHKPERIIVMGMDATITAPKFETLAKNEIITLKNPIYRFIGKLYIYWLKWNNKNYLTKKTFPEESLTTLPINKNKASSVQLKSNIPQLEGINVSSDAGNYVCNYIMWVIENHIRDNNLDIDFYFIHLPINVSQEQKQTLLRFIQLGKI